MENTFNAIKEFILTSVNKRLPDYNDEEITLAEFTENSIVFGAVDLQKNNKNLVCAILPEEQSEEEGTITDFRSRNNFTVAILVRGDTYEKLVKKMCRYSEAFRDELLRNYTMNNTVADIELGTRQFFYDAGTTEKQMCAVEIELTIYLDETI